MLCLYNRGSYLVKAVAFNGSYYGNYGLIELCGLFGCKSNIYD